MPKTKRKGPLSAADGGDKYALEVYQRLHPRSRWHPDILQMLEDEFAFFREIAWTDQFGVRSMWEFTQLVGLAYQYQRAAGSAYVSAWLRDKVLQEQESICAQLVQVQFDEREQESMRRAMGQIAYLIKTWEAADKARG